MQTLIYGLQSSGVSYEGARVLFLNAQFHEDICVDWDLQNYFKPAVDAFVGRGFQANATIQSGHIYDVILYLLPKNIIEAKYGIAQALSLLSDDGVLFCAADNKAGGSRLGKLYDQFGMSLQGQEMRHKARVLWGRRSSDFHQGFMTQALQAGGIQDVLGGRYISQAGVFGWDKVDKGSEILIRYIPTDLKGKGADFGCGYGFLSDFVLSHCPKVKRIHCLDADYRAVDMCRRNLSQYNVEANFVWTDLTKPQDDLHHLDFVVMNPPFHEGKKQDIQIGIDFIRNAYSSIKRGGSLYMVANAHLPYENVLGDVFFASEKLHEGQGFKVFKALR